MVEEWFSFAEKTPPYKKFKTINFHEAEISEDKKIEKFSKIYVNNIHDVGFLKKVASKIGWLPVIEDYVKKSTSKKPTMKKGRFGEMLNGEILEKLFDYIIPINCR